MYSLPIIYKLLEKCPHYPHIFLTNAPGKSSYVTVLDLIIHPYL